MVKVYGLAFRNQVSICKAFTPVLSDNLFLLSISELAFESYSHKSLLVWMQNVLWVVPRHGGIKIGLEVL